MEQQDTGPGPQETAPQETAPQETAPQETAQQETGPRPGAARGTVPDAAAVDQPSTGDARVDEALSRLDELAGLPVAEHPAVFEQVHRRLAEALGELGPDSAGH